MELQALTQRAENIALEALDHPNDFMPRTYMAPDAVLGGSLVEARGFLRAGLRDQARDVLQRVCADRALRLALGAFREHVNWVEADNARRLATLCWVHATLLPRAAEGDGALLDKLDRLETLALREYGLSALSTERGWAEAQTRRLDLLPADWRNA